MPGALNLLLANGLPVGITNGAMSGIDTAVSPAHAASFVSIDGVGFVTGSGAGPDFQLVAYGNPALLEIFITTLSGTPPTSGSPVGSWISLPSRSWTLTTSTPSTLTYSATYSVRLASTGQVIGGGTFNLSSTES